MDRRRYLQVVGAALAGLAGCGTRPPAIDATEPPTTARASLATEPTPTASPTRPPRTDTATPKPAAAVSLETARYLVRSFAQDENQRAIDGEQVTTLADVDQPLRSALQEAIEGGFEADVVSTALLRGIDRFRLNGGGYRFTPYVRHDGTAYVFEPSVPVFTARLEMGVSDPPPERTVGPDDLQSLEPAARDLVRTIGAFSVQVARDTYRRSAVPDAVRAFLAEYDYARDPDGIGRIVTERIDPGPPYTITARELTTEERWGRPVLDLASLPADLGRFVEAVVTSDRRAPALRPGRTEYRTDAIPDAYVGTLTPDQGPGSGPYVDVDGTFYALRATELNREAMPVAVSVERAGDRSFAVTVEPSAAGDKPAIEGRLELEAAGALPSVLWVPTDDGLVRLDSDASGDLPWRFAEEPGERYLDHVHAELQPDESLSATYRVPEVVPTGAYRAWGLFEAEWTRATDGRRFPRLPYPFQVVLEITSK